MKAELASDVSYASHYVMVATFTGDFFIGNGNERPVREPLCTVTALADK
jgi:hypothetical protein